jgi:Clp amino terminal domain, pathogenicity island component
MESAEQLSQEVTARAASGDPLDRLAAAVVVADHVRDTADELIDRYVGTAREQGRSWSEIGRVLGVSKQAAQQRFVVPAGGGAWPKDFDDDARALLPTAELHARRFRHRYLGTEHLLLALTENPGLAGTTLRRLGVDAAYVSRQIRELIGEGHSSETASLGVTPRTKRVMEAAGHEGRRRGHRCAIAAPEDVLLALVARHDGVAAQILGARGVDEARVRRQLSELLAGEAPEMAAKILEPPRRRLARRAHQRPRA